MKPARLVATLLFLTAAAGCGSTPIGPGNLFGPGPDAGPGPGVTAQDGGGTTPVPAADGGGADIPHDQRIACGMATTCSADTEECCVNRQGQSCAAKGQCQGTALSCSGARSCDVGEVCCATGTRTALETSCAATCPSGSTQLCESDAECGVGAACQPQQRGLGICGPMVTLPPPRDGGPRPRPDGGPDTGLVCGNVSCDPATQDCCVSLQGGACGPRGSCGASSLSCTSPAACTDNQVCCATAGFMGGVMIQSSCQDSCMGGGGGGITLQLCRDDADCPMGVTCQDGIGGIRSCRGGRMGGGGGG